MQRSNVNPCPHHKDHAHIIRTSDGKSALLCQSCMGAMEQQLSDPEMIRGMLKATMTGPEVQKMRHERENIAIEQDLADTVAAAFAVAGYPRMLMLSAPVM